MGQKLCFVCFSPTHLIKDCDRHSEYLSKFPRNKSNNQRPREHKPVWTNSNRVNHRNFTPDHRYPHQKRPSVSHSTFQSTAQRQGTENHTWDRNSRRSHYQPRRYHNSYRGSRSQEPSVKTEWVKRESTAEGQTVLSTKSESDVFVIQEKANNLVTEIYVEKSESFENPHAKDRKILLDHHLKDSGNYILKEFEFVTPQGEHKSVMAWVPKSF